jgi:sulfonate transport system ATP-binding protein
VRIRTVNDMTTTATAPAQSTPALPVSLNGVGRAFAGPIGEPERIVLRDVDLRIAPGEIVALLGPSGCGKSTLLRQISGLDRPTTGSLTINGLRVSPADQRCAVAFQEPRLLPWRSVARNIELGLPRGTDRAAGRARVAELLELVQLTHATTLKPRQISGGMAQRVSLARALARGPGVLLLDEPFGALDALTRLTMQDLLVDIHRAEPATIVLVTHDVDEALALADRIILLGTRFDRPGATISRVIEVPGARPRDRASTVLARLRAQLLDALGVPSHHDR